MDIMSPIRFPLSFITVFILNVVILTEGYYYPLDLGQCTDEHVTCGCGKLGGAVDIRIPRCTIFHRWEQTCVPCQPYDKTSLCAKYEYCTSCSNAPDEGCSACAQGRFGKTCNHECGCENNAPCEQYTGRCLCPPGRTGNLCQTKIDSSCLRPEIPLNGAMEGGEFTEGSTVRYRCNENFVLIGSSARTCFGNGRWSGTVPTCEYTCSIPPPKDHLQIQVQATEIRSPVTRRKVELVREINFNCDPGYGIRGLSRLVCLPTGEWNTQIPICERTCGEPLPVPHSRKHGSSHFNGDSVTYSCNGNYQLVGPATISCLHGKWTGHPVCKKVTVCPDPLPVPNGEYRTNGTGFGVDAKVEYFCAENFNLEGPSVRTCLRSGKWSGQEPWCAQVGFRSVCPKPPLPENGIALNLEYIPAFPVGVRVRYSCEEGHVVSGQRDRICQENGTWSGDLPRCIKVLTCDQPSTPKNTHINVIEPDNVHSRRGWRLPEFAFARTSRTQAKHEDSGLVLPEGKYRVATKILFTCESNFYKLVGSRQRTCQSNGEWSGRQPTCLPVCGQAAEPRKPFIVNGTAAKAGQFPWQAGIAYRDALNNSKWDILCGGSLLNENWVVTAAHCVTVPRTIRPLMTDVMKIYLGKHYRDTQKNDDQVQVRRISKIVVNRDFTPRFLDSDIALLKLDRPVTITERMLPICLPNKHISEIHLRPGSTGVVSGWGVREHGQYAKELYSTKVQTITNKDCQDKYAQVGRPQSMTDNMFCAGFDDGHADACTGDSGGPLIFTYGSGIEKRWYLEGLVSWGNDGECGQPFQYGAYTKIARFVEWIHHTI